MASHEGEVAVDICQYSTFCTNEFYGYANERLAVGVSDVAANTVILSLLFCLLSVSALLACSLRIGRSGLLESE